MNIEQLKARYAVKRFDPDKKISSADLEVLKNAFHLCPSSLNIQAWKLVIVESESMKLKIAECGRNRNVDRLKDCSHVLVLARKKIGFKHIDRVLKGTEMLQVLVKNMGLNLFKMKMFMWVYSKINGGSRWTSNQVYLALGFLLATCAARGIGALPMEGVFKKRVDKLLGFEGEYKTEVAICIGFAHQKDSTNPSKLNKSRLPFDEIVEVV
ncbi:nitroreductase family protein [bacterium]|nr:nitroreductase family protein [bacterium]